MSTRTEMSKCYLFVAENPISDGEEIDSIRLSKGYIISKRAKSP